jgi:hypothetical protein
VELANNPLRRTHSRVPPLAEARKRRATRRAAERVRYAPVIAVQRK